MHFLQSIKTYFFRIFTKPGIPDDYFFCGHLDSPRNNHYANAISGWYLSKTPFYKVVACLNGKVAIEIKPNAIRKDVALKFGRDGYASPEMSGFNYGFPEEIVRKILRGRLFKKAALTIRFYLNENDYVDQYQVQFILFLDEYDLFLIKQNKLDRKISIRSELKKLKYLPKISIVTPVYKPPKAYFIKMLESVFAQAYLNYEFCICFDGKQPEWEKILKRYKGSKIKAVINDHKMGISAATNKALELASGEFVAFLDHDDVLHRLALLEVVKCINKNKNVDLIYTDEDKIGDERHRAMPFFKPDFSPHQLLCQNYISHLLVIRKKIVDRLGGLSEDPKINGSQDWDLILRVQDATKHIVHIPKILYSWRYNKSSYSLEKIKTQKYFSFSRNVLRDHIIRNGFKAKVINGLVRDTYKVDLEIIGNPKVSVIMPTGGKIKLLTNAISSVLKNTSYNNYEIIVVDNSEDKRKKITAVKELIPRFRSKKIKYFRKDLKPFNFSKLINYGVKKASGEYLLFFNDDMEVINKEWMSEMLKIGQLKDVGAVGAKLYYPNDTIQHVGVVVGLYEVADHIFKQKDRKDTGYFFSNYIYKDYLAVTGACLLTKKKLFNMVNGLNSTNFKVAYQDIDYCMRLYDKGYFSVVTPYAELLHHEALTKIVCLNEGELEHFQRKWGKYIEKDPFYNPNLSKRSLEYKIDV